MGTKTSASRGAEMTWKVASSGAGIVSSVAVRKMLQAMWPSVGDAELEPPLNPADRRIDWSTALQWAVAAGVGAGVARLVGQRAAARGWEMVTGSAPPGIET